MVTNYSTSEMSSGTKVLMNNEPYSVISNEFVKPGKGQAFNRIKLRNLKTEHVIERTFKSGDTLPGADVVELEAQYLYNDGSYWYFMDLSTYDQYSADEKKLGDTKQWLKEQDICTLVLWNGEILTITPPTFVILKIADTDPGLRGDTSGGGSKPATLETGAVVRIPLFIQTDELIKIDTRTGEYISRVKE
jgi:elongation factor P